jgi:hypothetical protein
MAASHRNRALTSGPRRCGELGLAFALYACAVDDRRLELAADDAGFVGSFSGGESGAGGAAPDGQVSGRQASPGLPNSAGGTASTGGGLVDGCADLDTDGVADCEITLVQGPTFASDVDGWTPLGEAELTWDPRNALDDLPSGSARLSAGTPRAGAVQCVPVEGARLIIAYASAFVETADEALEPASAQLEISFFDANDCAGAVSGYFETPRSNVTGAWATIHAGGVSTPATRSISIVLGGSKGGAAELHVYFDNVMLKTQDL